MCRRNGSCGGCNHEQTAVSGGGLGLCPAAGDVDVGGGARRRGGGHASGGHAGGRLFRRRPPSQSGGYSGGGHSGGFGHVSAYAGGAYGGGARGYSAAGGGYHAAPTYGSHAVYGGYHGGYAGYRGGYAGYRGRLRRRLSRRLLAITAIGAAATGAAVTGRGPTTVTVLPGFCRYCRSPTRPIGMPAFRTTTPMTCTTPGIRTIRAIRRPIRRRWRPGATLRQGRHRQPVRRGRRISAGQSGQIFMYPMNDQSAEQQATDRRECQQWAAQQTGQGAAGGSDYQRAMIACIEGRGYSAQ